MKYVRFQSFTTLGFEHWIDIRDEMVFMITLVPIKHERNLMGLQMQSFVGPLSNT